MKGTWTHCPSHSYLSKIAKQYQVATKLLNKVFVTWNLFSAFVLTLVWNVQLSEVCLRAYRSEDLHNLHWVWEHAQYDIYTRSFHRSLQSAAFLQILLLFVAISSRTQSLSQELEKIVQDIRDCTERLISVIFVGSIISASIRCTWLIVPGSCNQKNEMAIFPTSNLHRCLWMPLRLTHSKRLRQFPSTKSLQTQYMRPWSTRRKSLLKT